MISEKFVQEVVEEYGLTGVREYALLDSIAYQLPFVSYWGAESFLEKIAYTASLTRSQKELLRMIDNILESARKTGSEIVMDYMAGYLRLLKKRYKKFSPEQNLGLIELVDDKINNILKIERGTEPTLYCSGHKGGRWVNQPRANLGDEMSSYQEKAYNDSEDLVE